MVQERNTQAKSARSVFFEDENDIDIYIEDTAFGYEKLFQILFSRLFQGEYRVNKVFPLGGRKAVTDEYENHSTNRKSLYIIDSDLFLLTGDEVENKSGLYKLPFYCIENLLCDDKAILSFLDEEEPIKFLEKIDELFDYNDWVIRNENKLFRLFVEYAITFELNPEEQTVAYKVSNLVSCNKGLIDENKLEQRIQDLRAKALLKATEEDYNNTRNKILAYFESSGLSKLDVVSGKDYLFPLLKTRAKSLVNTKVPDLNIKMRLAMKCNLDRIEQAKNHVMI